MSVLEQPEVARRLRAALAYGGVSRAQAAELLHVTPSTLHRYTSGRTHYTPGLQRLWEIADLAGLPREWFMADFARLAEIVPPGLPVFSRADADALPVAPPGELGRIARGTEPTPASQSQSGSRRDTGARRGSA